VGGAQVLFYGRFGEKEPLGYLGVAKLLADQTQYLLLARREDGARRRGQPRVLAGHPDRHHRTQDAGRASEAPRVPRFPYGLAEPAVVLVVAEGVGTAEQLAKVRELGCDLAQGHLYAEAVPSEAAKELVSRGIWSPGTS
jgi:hypothetical protein